VAARRETCRLILLGSTGSIGTQTLQVVEHLNSLHGRGEWPTRYQVVGLAAGRNAELLAEQAMKFGVSSTALGAADSDSARGGGRGGTFTWQGADAPERLIRAVECDLVVAAITGAAGLPATLAAVELGRDVALANKETLVAAGAIIIPAAVHSGSRLLPVDSEHSGLWQCLHCVRDAAPPFDAPANLERAILTASGGPFRTWSREDTFGATPGQALKHPTWSMGPKVTVDSASLTNKAMEIIEAHWLFGLPPDKIDVLIHPQSIVHAMAEFTDGSVMAHLGAPDMRGPIQYALSYPGRPEAAQRRLDWSTLRSLEFEPPDHGRFPALGLAYAAIRAGGAAGAILNAANEAAVEAFLAPTRTKGPRAQAIPFGRITQLAAEALDSLGHSPLACLDDALRADARARAFVRDRLSRE